MTTNSSWEKKAAADSDDDSDDLVAADGTSTMTVEDAAAFDCGVCYLPFKPPIFQCTKGHAVCSTCREKLMATGNTRCHVCRVDLAGRDGYIRSHSLERMVESVRVPCPYAAHGCAARPVYYDRSTHRRTCPYRCPVRPLRQFFPWRSSGTKPAVGQPGLEPPLLPPNTWSPPLAPLDLLAMDQDVAEAT